MSTIKNVTSIGWKIFGMEFFCRVCDNIRQRTTTTLYGKVKREYSDVGTWTDMDSTLDHTQILQSKHHLRDLNLGRSKGTQNYWKQFSSRLPVIPGSDVPSSTILFLQYESQFRSRWKK
jgi:hypothetical protein